MAQSATQTAPWEDYAQQKQAPGDGPWADYQAQGGWGGAANAYGANPTIDTGKLKTAVVNNLPAIGGIGGGMLGGPVGAGAGGLIGQAGQDYLNGYKNADGTTETTPQKIYRPLVSGALQGAAQGAAELAAPYISKAVGAVSKPVSDWLSDMAEEKAVEATGATGKQAAEFADDAGRQLLDRGIVKFGNSQAAVAAKSTAALEKAGTDIGSTLSDLDSRGATVDQADIVDSLRKRATQLSDDPSQFSVSDQLNRLADRIQTNLEAKGGNSSVPLSAAENTKRGFQQAANYNSSPLDLTVSKEAANVYRQAVEDAAVKFDPQTGKTFQDAKSTYKLLSPIEEAAGKRAMTLGQSPKGGLLDTSTAIAGAALGGGPGAVALPILRRAGADRIAPALAGAADLGSKIVGSAPAVAGAVTPAVTQALVPQFGLMAPPPQRPQVPPNYSTIPGKNGH